MCLASFLQRIDGSSLYSWWVFSWTSTGLTQTLKHNRLHVGSMPFVERDCILSVPLSHVWIIKLRVWIIGHNEYYLIPGRHFTDDSFKCIFVNEKLYTLIKVSLYLAPKGPMYNNLSLLQIVAWCRIGDKPLSESILTRFSDAYIQHWG